MTRTLQEIKIRIPDVCVSVDIQTFPTVWNATDYCFDVCRITNGGSQWNEISDNKNFENSCLCSVLCTVYSSLSKFPKLSTSFKSSHVTATRMCHAIPITTLTNLTPQHHQKTTGVSPKEFSMSSCNDLSCKNSKIFLVFSRTFPSVFPKNCINKSFSYFAQIFKRGHALDGCESSSVLVWIFKRSLKEVIKWTHNGSFDARLRVCASSCCSAEPSTCISAKFGIGGFTLNVIGKV